MNLNGKNRSNKLLYYFKNRSQKKFKRRFFLVILCIFLTAVFIRNYLFFALRIDSLSMHPALNPGDYCVFSRLSLGLKKPFSENKKNNLLFRTGLLKCGDLIACADPDHKPRSSFFQFFDVPLGIISLGTIRLDPQVYIVRRVLARPGEKVEIKNKQIYINDSPFTPFWNIYFPDRRILPEAISRRDNMPPVIVASGEFFLISDNWDYSMDSRMFGTVPAEKIHARAIKVFRWF
ncbi:MAG: signal peptidase I [Spirochaetes bacterium GWF1_41_5]|nr:MAG: signal peptidase I [Spirochaetes bacterium GWF1_41_5]HBE03925.1 signal peptidase I [Spirochaetia bacterium]